MLESSYKVIFLGEEDVGKMNIINSFVYGISSGNSIGSSGNINKSLILEDGKKITFDLFDTPEKEKYNKISKNFYENTKVIIFVYDITNKKSFDKIKNYWYKQCKKYLVESEIIYALVGNNCDLYEQQEVNNDETEEFAQNLDAIFTLISNKDNDKVQSLFENIAKILIRKEENKKVEKDDEKINNKIKQKGKCIII